MPEVSLFNYQCRSESVWIEFASSFPPANHLAVAGKCYLFPIFVHPIQRFSIGNDPPRVHSSMSLFCCVAGFHLSKGAKSLPIPDERVESLSLGFMTSGLIAETI